jgi:hypothetical protein
MNARPWLAAFTYFAHILFVLKYAINYLLYFATNKVIIKSYSLNQERLFILRFVAWLTAGGSSGIV